MFSTRLSGEKEGSDIKGSLRRKNYLIDALSANPRGILPVCLQAGYETDPARKFKPRLAEMLYGRFVNLSLEPVDAPAHGLELRVIVCGQSAGPPLFQFLNP
jgi:hypothetical protein